MIRILSFLFAFQMVQAGTVTPCEFYNNAKCAVIVHSDDYGNQYWLFDNQARVLQQNGMVLSVGVVAKVVAQGGIWSAVQNIVTQYGASVSSHSWSHDMRETYTTSDIPLLSDEVTKAYTSIVANVNQTFQRYNGTNHCLGWIEPGSAFGRTQFCRDIYYTNLVTVGQLCGRSDSRGGSTWAEWNTTYGGGIYYETPFNGVGSDYTNHVAIFNNCYSNGLIYTAYNHAYDPSFSVEEGSDFYRIIQYIGNRPDVWYVGFGESYSYHYTVSNAVVALTENGTNSLIDVSIDESLRSRFALSYPITLKYQFPSNWKGVSQVEVKCIQNGTTNTLQDKTRYELFSGQNANRIDVYNGCVYISQAFAEIGTNYTLVVTPVQHGIPRYIR